MKSNLSKARWSIIVGLAALVVITSTSVATWVVSAAHTSALKTYRQLLPAVIAPTEIWHPTPGTTWQWQLSGLPVDLSINAAMYDIDLFDRINPPASRQALAERLGGFLVGFSQNSDDSAVIVRLCYNEITVGLRSARFLPSGSRT